MCNPRPAPETGRDDSGKAFPSDSQVEARLSYPYLSCQLGSLYWHLCSVPLPGRFGSLFCSAWHHSYIHRAIHISSISPLHLGKTQQLKGDVQRALPGFPPDFQSTKAPLVYATPKNPPSPSWSSSHRAALPVILACSSLPQHSPASFLLWQILPWQQ